MKFFVVLYMTLFSVNLWASPIANQEDKLKAYQLIDTMRHELQFRQHTVKQVNEAYTKMLSAYSILIDQHPEPETLAKIKFNHSNPYDLGDIAVGSVRSLVIEMVNTGETIANEMDISELGPYLSFRGGVFPGTGGTCSTQLDKGSSCTLVLSFEARQRGVLSTQIDLTYNNGLKVKQTQLELLATVISPAYITISDGPYNFNTVAIGSSKVKTFTITNSGQGIASAMSGGGLASPYTFQGGTYPGMTGDCGTSLAPLSTCTVVVAFSPTVPGLQVDAMEIDYFNGGQREQSTTSLSGAGGSAASITVSKTDTFDFGRITVGATALQTFTLTNSGGVAALGITPFPFRGDFAYEGWGYPGATGTCSTRLNPGASCDLVVGFLPVIAGLQSDQVKLAYDNGVQTAVIITRLIQGTGVGPGHLSISPKSYHFGSVTRGSGANATLTVVNNGASVVTGLSGGLSAPFEYRGGGFPGLGGTCGQRLGAGGSSCTVVVSFLPLTQGAFTESLVLNYNDGVAANSVIADLSGNSGPPALLTVSESDPFDFLDVTVGSSAEHTFVITNAGDFSATAMTPVFSSRNFQFKNGVYPGTGGTCASTLAPAGTCNVVVEYSPGKPGRVDNATLELSYFDGAVTQSVSRDLTGTAVLPANLVASPNPANFGSVEVGRSTHQTLTLINGGGSDAINISEELFNGEFSFPGGEFPGGGTCSASLAAGGACTVVIRFSAVADVKSEKDLKLSYYDGAQNQLETVRLVGSGFNPTPPQSPSSWTTQLRGIPMGSVSMDHTPTLMFSDIKFPSNYKIIVYGDQFCSVPLAEGHATGSTAEVDIEFESDGSDDGAKYFYAKSEDKNGHQSPCDYVANYTLDTIVSRPSVLQISGAPVLNYGSVGVGQEVSAVLTVSVAGELAIKDVDIHNFESEGFYFKGGFPGQGGTCTTNFFHNCTLVISFMPTENESYSDTLKISYKSGHLKATAQRKLAGFGQSKLN